MLSREKPTIIAIHPSRLECNANLVPIARSHATLELEWFMKSTRYSYATTNSQSLDKLVISTPITITIIAFATSNQVIHGNPIQHIKFNHITINNSILHPQILPKDHP